MKRTALLSFALGALCAHAQAQDNVTLYGIIDAGINYVSNVRGTNGGGSSQFALTSGPMQGSRWGIKGSEDLGGGLKAIFTLENGFTVNTGTAAQGGTEFGRQAFVGLSGAFGKVTLGRQYDMGVDFVAPYTANRYLGYFAAHPDDLDNLNQTVRLNNSIKYVSPEYHGLSAGIVYAFGGKPGSVSTQQIVSLGCITPMVRWDWVWLTSTRAIPTCRCMAILPVPPARTPISLGLTRYSPAMRRHAHCRSSSPAAATSSAGQR